MTIDAYWPNFTGGPAKAFNQAVKRHSERFPAEFMYQLTAYKNTEVVTNCDYRAKLKFFKSLSFVITEHGKSDMKQAGNFGSRQKQSWGP